MNTRPTRAAGLIAMSPYPADAGRGLQGGPVPLVYPPGLPAGVWLLETARGSARYKGASPLIIPRGAEGAAPCYPQEAENCN